MFPCLVLLAFVLCIARAEAMPTRLSPTHLRCEYLSNPLGLDVLQPRLGWALESDQRGQAQTAYEILVAASSKALRSGKGDLWRSGKMRSDRAQHIVYRGVLLRSRLRCYWKVRVWDKKGKVSRWSAPATWEMGLLHPRDWQAKWIGGAATQDDSSPRTLPAPYFRKTFSLLKPVKTARAYFCGLGFGELWLNGHKVGDEVLSPNQTDYDQRPLRKLLYPFDDATTKRVLYVAHDVTRLLRPGANAIGAILGNGWYNQRDRRVEGELWYGAPRLLLQMHIEFTDGTQTVIGSDESWKTSTGPLLHDAIFTGEIYDARLDKIGWNQSAYDDAAWEAARLMRAPMGRLNAQLSPPDKVVQTIQPISLSSPKPSVWVFDMGRNMAGWARLKVQEPAGTTIKLRFIEDGGSDYGQSDTFIAKGEGTELYEPRFTWHAFRRIEVSGCTRPLSLHNIEGRVVHSAVTATGSFACSNSLFNTIYENFRRTQLDNLHGGVPSDCPHRERLGYTGDGHLSAQAAIYSFDMSRFYSKWMRDIADAQNKKTGFVPHTAPFEGGGGGPAWGSACVLMPWYLYLYYGDRRVLEEHYGGMKQWLAYLGTRTDADGIIVREEPGGWCLGDWCAPTAIKLPPELVNTCYYARVAGLVSRVAAILGKPAEAAQFSRLKAQVAGAVNKRFLDAARGQYSIGRQGADVFPLAFDLVPPAARPKVLGHLIDHIVTTTQSHLDTGILATPLLLDVLTANQRAGLAYTMMNQRDFPGYGHMIAQGATTLWETWQGEASRNHPMFGSVCAWFFDSLAGIAPDAANVGFKNIIVRPQIVGDLTFAAAQHDAPQGRISSRWTRRNGIFTLDLTIPPNSTATVFLPGTDIRAVSESGAPASRVQGVKFLRAEDDRLVFQIESGRYRFVVPTRGLERAA